MATDRRTFLAGAAAALVTHSHGAAARAEMLGAGVFVSARMDTAGKASLAVFTLEGQELASAELPGRGHDMAVSPDRRRIVAFARRPGDWGVVVGTATGTVEATLRAGPGRHFVGHGFFSADSATLATAEEDETTGAGVLALRDVRASYAIREELPTFGIGPHDVADLPDGRMVIANGGIPVDPVTRDDKADLPTMRSDLVVLDRRGTLIERHALAPELRLSSMRHLSVAPDGTIAFGCQWQGTPEDGPMLVGIVKPGGKPELIAFDEDENAGFNNYIGSVAFDPAGDVFIVSSPRGGRIGLFDRASGRYLGSRRLGDVCGIAGIGRGTFVLTSGNAGLRIADVDRQDLRRFGGPGLSAYAWDNHVRRL